MFSCALLLLSFRYRQGGFREKSYYGRTWEREARLVSISGPAAPQAELCI
jgi:hypothetical protein